MRVFLHKNRGEATLEEMPDPAMEPVVRLRIAAVELRIPRGEGRLGRFDEQMIVVVHQAIGMAEPPTRSRQLLTPNDGLLFRLIVMYISLTFMRRTLHSLIPNKQMQEGALDTVARPGVFSLLGS